MSVKVGDKIKGKDLVVGMKVRRYVSGKYLDSQSMIVYSEGPYFNNPLYAEDFFQVDDLDD
jgi:hypothetical protein